MCPFRRKMVTRRLNALGFSTQLLKFVQNPAEDLESGVCSYLASINRCTNHCASIIWIGAFLKNRRKAQERRPAHAHVRRRIVCEAREVACRGAASHYDRGGVKGAIRALRVGSSKYSGLWERQESSMHRSSRSMGGLDAGYVRLGGLVEDGE